MTDVEVRPAATVLLVREQAEDIEILLLRRNSKLTFASGFWVFPGGKIDPFELEGSKTEEQAARKAAVREVKEESDLDILESSLEFFVHWTTPKMQIRRFGTYFFHSQIDKNHSQVTVDGSEILEHKWLSPKAALKLAHDRQLALLPPTYVNLQRVTRCRNYTQVAKEFSRVRPQHVIPTVGIIDSYAHCMYQGDAGFEHANPSTPGPRHRLIYNYKKGDYKFEFKGCTDQFPLNGGY